MDPFSRGRAGFAVLLLAVLATGGAVVLLTGEDEDDDESPHVAAAGPEREPAEDRAEPDGVRPRDPRGEDDADGARERSRLQEAIGPGRRPEGAAERGAAHAVEAYVQALDARDGEAACGLFAAGALEELELPRITMGGCAGSLEASIGYRDPRGSPVWEGAEIEAIQSTSVDGDSARVVITVVTRFADRAGVSVEDDVVYLVRARGRWLVAKPSATLYRAVGYPDVPPSAISPPQGGDITG